MAELRVDPSRPVAVSTTSGVLLGLVSVAGLVSFTWPLLATEGAVAAGAGLAPLIFALILPVILAVVVSHLSGDDLDVKALAMLGVMSAVVAAVRPLGPAAGGIETVFFPIIIAARVFGPGFGFLLGNTGLLVSALLTGGVGPWLPHQMLGSAMIGLISGLLPTRRLARPGTMAELLLLGGWAAIAAFAYGWLLDLSNWPFAVGGESSISFDATLGPLANLHRFVLFNVATSMGWNLGRAITTCLLIVVLGPALLRILRRAARRANFVNADVV